MEIDKIQDEIIDEFSFFGDWMEKYEYLIELGKSLPMIDENFKDEDHLIRGCQSQLWLRADLDEKEEVVFTADSDAVITKGIISLLIRVLSHQSPKTIAETELYFIDRIGLTSHLSPTRSNGLLSMVKQMKMYGLAFQAQSKANG